MYKKFVTTELTTLVQTNCVCVCVDCSYFSIFVQKHIKIQPVKICAHLINSSHAIYFNLFSSDLYTYIFIYLYTHIHSEIIFNLAVIVLSEFVTIIIIISSKTSKIKQVQPNAAFWQLWIAVFHQSRCTKHSLIFCISQWSCY